MSQHEIHAGSVPFPESGGGFAHGFAHCQGRRPYMEDEVMVDIPLADGVRMFAVFDGHAGRKAIERIVEWVPEELRLALSKCTDADEWPRLTPEAITAAMLNVDTKLLAASEAEENWDDGATALLAITLDGEPRNAVQLVQLGDGQAVLGGAMGVEALCAQHRVGDDDEDARLAECGASTEDGRVTGNGRAVAVTRSLGDAAVKRATSSGLIAVPSVTEQSLSAADELIILGSDGLWDVFEPQDAYDVAKKAGRARNGEWDLAASAKALVQGALDRKSGDNISTVLIGLKRPRNPGGQRGGARATAAGANKPRPEEVATALQKVALK